MKSGTYMNLTLTRGILLVLLILSPMAGVLADMRCVEDCDAHSQIKMSITKCCHSAKSGISVRTAQECDDEVTLNMGEYAQPIQAKSAKNVLFSETITFPEEEASPKFQFENDFCTQIPNIISPAIYLLDSVFLI